MASLLEAFYILFESRGSKEVADETEKLRGSSERAAAALDRVGDAQRGMAGAAGAARQLGLSLSQSGTATEQIVAGARRIAAAEANLRGYLLGNQALREETLDALGGQAGLQERINAETAQLARQMIRVESETDQAADEAGRLARNVRLADDNAGRLAGSFQRLLGPALAAFGGFSIGRGALDAAETYSRFGNALRVAGLEGDRLSTVQDALYRSAVRNGSELESLGQLYGRVSSAATELGVSEQEILQVTDAVSSAVRIQGGDAQSASGAMLQLAQALGAGTVRAEEFNSINEGMLPLLQAAAGASEKYGGSVAKLRAAVMEGSVTSKEFFDLIRKGSAELELKAAKAPLTVAQSVQNLKTAWTRTIGTFNEALGITRGLSGALSFFAQNLDTALIGLGVALTAAAVIAWTVYTPAMTAAAAATIAATWPILAIIAAALAVGAAFALAYDDIKAFLSGQPSLIGALAEKYEWFGALIEGLGVAFRVTGRVILEVFRNFVRMAGEAGRAIEKLIEIVGPTFRAIWDIAGPILGFIAELFWAVATRAFNAFENIRSVVTAVLGEIMAHPWVAAILNGIQAVQTAFGIGAGAIWAQWGPLLDKLIAGVNIAIAGARTLFGMGGADKNWAAAREALSRGRGQLAAAGASGLAAQTSNSVVTRNGGNRTYNMPVTASVDARGLSPDQVTRAFSTSMTEQLSRSTASFDDGVSH